MKKIIVLIFSAFIIMSCGSDIPVEERDPYQDREAAKLAIIKCVEDGGIPYFASGSNGYAYFITCDMTP